MNKRKSVLITGATSGVGFALAKQLLAKEYDVTVTGRSPNVLLELQNAGAKAISADLSKKVDVDSLVAQIGSPDIVIFSAGVGVFDFAHETADEAIQRMVDVNVIAPMQLTRRLLPQMMERGNGHLIFLGSQAGKVSTPKASVYAATKHAIIGYTNALRMEAVPHGIHVTAIHPGPIDTPFLDLADDTGNYRKSVGRHLLQVETVVDAVVQVMNKPVREVNLPAYMGISSKLYAVAPSLVERLGRKFFNLK